MNFFILFARLLEKILEVLTIIGLKTNHFELNSFRKSIFVVVVLSLFAVLFNV